MSVTDIQTEILQLHALALLDKLLADKTTGSNILWATDAYFARALDYAPDREIKAHLITGSNSDVIKTRARKALEQQTRRVRKMGEVFTPLWVCRKMNDEADTVWFGRTKAFFDENNQPTERVIFSRTQRKVPEWQRYVDTRRLEITCGEAPFLASRYNVDTARYIPVKARVGILDRKLRVVSENAASKKEWIKWGLRALQATYGYEYQGDNLLIARLNVFLNFCEHYEAFCGEEPARKDKEKAANIVAWNLWQMDGLKETPPLPVAKEQNPQIPLFGEEWVIPKPLPCRLYNWRSKGSVAYASLKKTIETENLLIEVKTAEKKREKSMKFDFVIGNPPYQEETSNERDRKSPIYHYFINAAYQIADKVILIHPARFLFNAGQTPKDWNKKMLNDEHLMVIDYTGDSSKIFPNTNIMGGIAITYHDENKNFGAIGTFVSQEAFRSLLRKTRITFDKSIASVVTGAVPYRFTDIVKQKAPDIAKNISRSFDLRSNILDKFYGTLFFDKALSDGYSYIPIFGLFNRKRSHLYIRKIYVDVPENFAYYKVCIPEANGSEPIGSKNPTNVIGQPFVALPFQGHTQTYISIGKFNERSEADALLKYIKTKLCRTLLGSKKVTQHNPVATWTNVPLQDFTPSSDIDWSQSIPEIDKQLYKKYKLTKKEIDFIETHVREMA